MNTSAPDPMQQTREAAEAAAPVLWLLGKAQAGKTSIIAELTGADREGIGNGFQRATLHAKVYAFPEEVPVVRFLDTRGLEDERAYDPAEDIAFAEAQAHLLLAVVRAEDLALDGLLDTLRAARKRHPDWPLLVAQTRPHDLYERGADHPAPYPYSGTEADLALSQLPDSLRRALAEQRRLFKSLPGAPPRFVVLDFTDPAAGYTPSNFGAEALWDALHLALPLVHERLYRGRDAAENARWQVIVPWAFAAAGADAVPAPFIGGLASTGLQARMVCAVAARFGLRMDNALWSRFVRLLGLAFGMRYGAKFLLRQGLKLLPGAGTAAVAVWSFAVTYALGEAAIYFCRETAAGREPEREKLRETYTANLEKAREIWRARRSPA